MNNYYTLSPVPHLRLSDKYPMILLTGEVAFSLHRSVVLSFGLIQNDTHPFPRGEESGADVRHRPTLALTDDLHQRAHFHRLPPAVRTHPADHTARQLTHTHTQLTWVGFGWLFPVERFSFWITLLKHIDYISCIALLNKMSQWHGTVSSIQQYITVWRLSPKESQQERTCQTGSYYSDDDDHVKVPCWKTFFSFSLVK